MNNPAPRDSAQLPQSPDFEAARRRLPRHLLESGQDYEQWEWFWNEALRAQAASVDPLKGINIVGRDVTGETIDFDGGPVQMENATISNCLFNFTGAAAQTLRFLALLEEHQPGVTRNVLTAVGLGSLLAATPAHIPADVIQFRPMESAPRDGTSFVWVRRITIVAVGKPAEYKFEATVMRRTWSQDEVAAPRTGEGYWTSQYSSIPDSDARHGWWAPLPQAVAASSPATAVDAELIRDVFMRNGFTIKPGEVDLKPYVYAAARDLLNSAALQASRQPHAQQAVAEGAGDLSVWIVLGPFVRQAFMDESGAKAYWRGLQKGDPEGDYKCNKYPLATTKEQRS